MADQLTQRLKSHGVPDEAVDLINRQAFSLEQILDFTDIVIKTLDEKGLKGGHKLTLLSAIDKIRKEEENKPSDPGQQEEKDTEEGPPQFAECFSDTICLKGREAQFEVRVNGIPTPDVQWFRKGKPLTPSDDVTLGADGDKHFLIIKNLKAKQSGKIKVKATNKYGSQSETASLSVVEKVKVVLCNTEDDWAMNDDVKCVDKLLRDEAVLPSVDCYRNCGANEKPAKFLETALQECHIGIIKVPKDILHMEAVVALSEQWKKNNYRKIIPIYVTEAEYKSAEETQRQPEFLRNTPLYMKHDDGRERADFKDKLKEAIEDFSSQDIKTLYPMGDASKGLAINYFTPISIMLGKEFQEKYLEKCKEVDPENSCQRVLKTVIAIPENCTCSFDLAAYGDEFKKENKHVIKLPRKEMHGLPRDMTMSMFKLHHGGENYLVRVEVPNIITTLNKMTDTGDERAINIDGVKKLSKEKMAVQRDAFVKEVQQFIDMRNSDKYILVPFDETKKTLANDIMKKVTEDIESGKKTEEQKTEEERRKDDMKKERDPVAVVIYDIPGEQKKDEQERTRIDEFKKQLEKGGVKIYINATAPFQKETEPVDCHDATVFFWVLDGKLTPKQEEVKYHYLNYQDYNQFKQLVPVVADETEQLQDKYFEGIQTYKYCDPGQPGHHSFIHDALELCKNKIPLTFPLGPIFHGLVWTAALNYLNPVLPGKVEKGMKSWDGKLQPSLNSLSEKVERRMKSKKQEVIRFPKLILLVEKHGRDAGGTSMNVTITLKPNQEGLPARDEAFLGEISDAIKMETRKILNIEEHPIKVKPIISKDDKESEIPQMKVSIFRRHREENYDASLEKLANLLADHIEKVKPKLILKDNIEVKMVSADAAGKKFEDFAGIKLGKMESQTADGLMAGVTKVITQGVYKIAYNDKNYIASFEFVRAVTCLGEIKNANLVPISMTQIEDQIDKFKKLFNDVAHKNIPNIKNYCDLLWFDGNDPQNRDDKNELLLNKIIAQFIDRKMASAKA